MPMLPQPKAAAAGSSAGSQAGGKKSAGDASPTAIRPAKQARSGKDKEKGGKGDKGEDKDADMADKDEANKPDKQKKKKHLSKPMLNQSALFSVLLKAMLQMQQAQRTMHSAIYDTFILEADSPEAKAMAAEGRKYNQLAQSDDPEEKAITTTPPHLFVFTALVQSLIARGESVGQKNLSDLQQQEQAFEALDETDKLEVIRVCRVDRTYHSTTKRLTLQVERSPCRGPLIQCLKQTSAIHKQGRAPASGLERDLQQWLQAFLSEQQ